MRDIRPILVSEEQLVVVCHLVGPFLHRFNLEVSRKIVDVAIELYEALAAVDKCVSELKYQDSICDILYHIKYQFTGDTIKNEIEGIIRGLRPSLQLRLRFIARLNIDSLEGSGTVASSSSTSTTGSNSIVSTSTSISGSTTPNSNTNTTTTTVSSNSTITSSSSSMDTSTLPSSSNSSSGINLPIV